MKFIPEKWKYILAENNLVTVTLNNIPSAELVCVIVTKYLNLVSKYLNLVSI